MILANISQVAVGNMKQIKINFVNCKRQEVYYFTVPHVRYIVKQRQGKSQRNTSAIIWLNSGQMIKMKENCCFTALIK